MNSVKKRYLWAIPILVILAGLLFSIRSQTKELLRFYLHPSEVTHAHASGSVVAPSKDASHAYLQFFALGDAGTGGFGQKRTARAMAQLADADPVSFVLYLGDNFYERGVDSVDDPQWTSKFESVYDASSLRIPFYAILGNHDYRSNPQAQVDYTKISERWRMPDRYYTFEVPIDAATKIQFFCLDSNPIDESSTKDIVRETASPKVMAQLRWLERELAGSDAQWKIVASHHPLYSNGEHGNSRKMIAAIKPILDRYPVDFVLSGHDHDLELLAPVDGVNYIICGAGAKHRDVDWDDETTFAATNLGFSLIRVSAVDAILEFFDRDGNPVFAKRFVP